MRCSSCDQPSPFTSTYSFAVSSKTKLFGRRRLNSAPSYDVWDSDMAAAVISERLFVRCFPPSRYRTRRAAAGILTILAEVRTLPALLTKNARPLAASSISRDIRAEVQSVVKTWQVVMLVQCKIAGRHPVGRIVIAALVTAYLL